MNHFLGSGRDNVGIGIVYPISVTIGKRRNRREGGIDEDKNDGERGMGSYTKQCTMGYSQGEQGTGLQGMGSSLTT